MPKLTFLCLFFFLLFSITAHATAVTYDHNSILSDSYTSESAKTTNYGTQGFVSIWSYLSAPNPPSNHRTYIMFNISSLPQNATINDANITLDRWTGGSGTRYVLVYNTSLNWNETNITWNAIPTTGTLQDNVSVNFAGSGKFTFNISNAVRAAHSSGGIVSIMFKDNNENSTVSYGVNPRSKESLQFLYTPTLSVNYTMTDCSADCGACGCNADNTGCFVPPIIGSYCDIADGMPDSIKTVPYANCSSMTIFDCPSGTQCTQVTPYFNSTTYPTTPGASNVCDGCIFFNMITGVPFNPHFVNIWTNCPADPECNCNGYYCSGNIYEAPNVSSTPLEIPQFSAGCFNPSNGIIFPIINGTGYNTSLYNLTQEACPTCNLTNQTPSPCANTSTICYDSSCNTVTCTTIAPAECSSNVGGQSALAIGALVGITDCGLSQVMIAMIVSIAVGFVLLFYTRNDGHGGQAFIFGTMVTLVLFTVIGWFYSWLMLILIVLGGYLVARSIWPGGGG